LVPFRPRPCQEHGGKFGVAYANTSNLCPTGKGLLRCGPVQLCPAFHEDRNETSYRNTGRWSHRSSYPSHRHDEDDYPNITYLEETYYHRLNPEQGFGIQRVYTEDGTLNETMALADGDVILVPRGHHPCGAPYGFEMYYLNVMAGPLRKWRFKPDPAVEWIMERDA
jgi:hypothetical protein